MAAELRRIGKSFDDRDVTLFPAIRPDAAGPFPSVGAHGCFMSHMSVLGAAETCGLDSILILEDDVSFVSDFAERAATSFEALSRFNWSVFYGGGVFGKALDERGVVEILPDTGILQAHFVAFRGQAIGEAYRYLKAMLARPAGDLNGGPMHVDGAYSWFRKNHPEFKTYAAAPPLAVQRSSRSDIFELKWFDRAPLVREAAQSARRLLRLI